MGVFSQSLLAIPDFQLRNGKPAVWLDARHIVVANGAAVSPWQSHSRNAPSFTEATAGNKPTFVSATPAVAFASASAQRLTYSGAPMVGQAGRVVAVVATSTTNATQAVYVQHKADSSTQYLVLGISDTNVIRYRYVNNLTVHVLIGDTVLGTDPHVLEWVSDGSAISMFVDGVAQNITVSSGSNDGSWFGDISGDNQTNIGGACINTSWATYWNGTMRGIYCHDADKPTRIATKTRLQMAARTGVALT